MKTIIDIGALLVVGVIALVLFEKFSAQSAYAWNAGSIADANRANANTQLEFDAGETAISALAGLIPQAPAGGGQ